MIHRVNSATNNESKKIIPALLLKFRYQSKLNPDSSMIADLDVVRIAPYTLSIFLDDPTQTV